jgi:hypothetical protein
MSFEDFIKLYTGIPCDFDGSYGTQCMDLAHFYKYIVLGIHDKTTLSAPSAVQVWGLNYPTLFDKISNSPTNFPIRGDIIIWGTAIGKDGHIAICTKADKDNFESFDANWPVGSKPHLQAHNYNGVLGWFHPLMITDTETELENLRKELEDERTAKEDYKAKAEAYKETCTSQADSIAKLNKKIEEDSEAIAGYRSQIAQLQGQFAEVSSQRDELLDTQKIDATNIQRLLADNKALNDKILAKDPLKAYSKTELVGEIVKRLLNIKKVY